MWYKCCYVKGVDGQNEQHKYGSHQTSWSVIQGVPRREVMVIMIFAHALFCCTLQKKYLQYLQQFICYWVRSSPSMLAVMWILAILHEDAFQTRRKKWNAQKIWLDCIIGANDTMWYHTHILSIIYHVCCLHIRCRKNNGIGRCCHWQHEGIRTTKSRWDHEVQRMNFHCHSLQKAITNTWTAFMKAGNKLVQLMTTPTDKTKKTRRKQ